MALERLALTNYRCFQERQEVEIRPITVVLGKNNSGKSALVRAPLVIATGLRGDSPVPLDLALLGDDAPDFIDLVHKHLDHGSIRFELGLSDESHVSATVQNIAEWHTQVVSDWSLQSPASSADYQWRPDEDTDESDVRPYWAVVPGRPFRGLSDVRFNGLLPVSEHGRASDRIAAEFGEVRHLGPFRTRPTRSGRLSARPPALDEFGSRAAEILIHDHVRRGGRLINKINEYLGNHLPGWELEVVPRYDAYSVGLRSTKTRGLWVPATDSGTGVAQVLPILIQRAQDELSPPRGDVLEIIEEPELHMHPSAQAGLADLYIQAARSSDRIRFMIETHSETFLLRLRRRIAEGTLPADRLGLYFVDGDGDASTVRRINVDALGNVDYWPEGIFAENFEEVRAMAVAQEDRQGTDAR
ncbi:AAA family ATPase [Actinomadura madurae]|uniref:AAA family ATPase n=1 Tax=Actinomadura madurae TaxID=1993 RepID=UPI0020D24B96|nr:DUF3696 domain-containing protein [Actinomadura madurae]MCQ0010554.1 AAA family ATPase [Actinomadura madurae]